MGAAPRPGAVAVERGRGVLVGSDAGAVIADDGSGGGAEGFERASVVLAAVARAVRLSQCLDLPCGEQGALIASRQLKILNDV